MRGSAFHEGDRRRGVAFGRQLDGLTREITTQCHALTLSDRVQKYSAYKKCDRCWNYSIQVGKSSLHPLLCGGDRGEVLDRISQIAYDKSIIVGLGV